MILRLFKLHLIFIFILGPCFAACVDVESVDLTSKHSDINAKESDSDTTTSSPSTEQAETDGISNVPSDIDSCPNDPDKLAPGICGCLTPDDDRDSDGTVDCQDKCPDDPHKTEPGVCDCGVPDLDGDTDGTMDCQDTCPDDPDKSAPGICNCGTPDVDSDGDGTMDCDDGCPHDFYKIAPGPCGCGVEAFSCWECRVAADCEPVEFSCEEPICVNGKCGTRPSPKGTKCRDSIDDCDDAEYCDGVHHRCPADSGIISSCIPDTPITVSSLGRILTITDVTINNRSTTAQYVRPESEVALQVTGYVIDTETNCGGCLTQYYVSLDDVFTLCLGSSSGDWGFTAWHGFKAPKNPGIYFIQIRDSWQFECNPEHSGLIPDSTVAIIRVE